jgi:hypothetical protein
MLSIEEAKNVVKQNLPFWNIKKFVIYNGLYVFQVYSDDPEEGGFDPFFSVNKSTGEFLDFSPFEDGNLLEITNLFARA